MFVRRHADPAETVTIHFDGEAIAAPRGETLAAVTLGELAALDDARLGKTAPAMDTGPQGKLSMGEDG